VQGITQWVLPSFNLDTTDTIIRSLRTLVMDHTAFANLLRQWRDRHGYSQRDAAEVLKVSKRSLENWEQERAMPQGFGLQAMLEIIKPKRNRK
jgi:DNA-binding transcriptional regulator YiaG